MAEKIILVAMTRDKVIGHGGTLPWSLPEELKLFRRLTLGHVVVMGRRTFQSLDGPLERRYNIVVSSTMAPEKQVRVCRSFTEAVSAAEGLGKKIFFIGGRDIFRDALVIADTLAVSWINEDFPGDLYFPDIDFSGWQKVCEQPCSGFRHVVYRRQKGTRGRGSGA